MCEAKRSELQNTEKSLFGSFGLLSTLVKVWRSATNVVAASDSTNFKKFLEEIQELRNAILAAETRAQGETDPQILSIIHKAFSTSRNDAGASNHGKKRVREEEDNAQSTFF